MCEKAQAIWELRHKHKIAILIEIAGIARSSYYYHANRLGQPDKYAVMKSEIFSIYQENKGRMGYRRITLELHNRGMCINHKTVLRLMRQLGLYCRVRMKKYSAYCGEIGTTHLTCFNEILKRPSRMKSGSQM